MITYIILQDRHYSHFENNNKLEVHDLKTAYL